MFEEASPRFAPTGKAPGLIIRVLFATFIIFHFPAFTYQLAMDITTGRWTGSALLQTATASSQVFAITMILASPDVRALARRAWLVWLPFALAFLSVLWSHSPQATLQSANTAMTTALLGLALAGWFPGFQAIKFMIRTMALGCLLSIIWVLAFPDRAVHQDTDVFQFVHAGLWRGIFSHKQGLGYFAGITTGLLLFYNIKILPAPALVGALGCSLACLVGTRSATGMVSAFLSVLLLFTAYVITKCDQHMRRMLLALCGVVALVITAFFQFGLLNFFFVHVLGKSTDLTGRTFFWEVILQRFSNSGRTLLGGGYAGRFAGHLHPMSVDNGYFEKFIEFGYLGSTLIFSLYALILWRSMGLLIRTRPENAMTNVFPIAAVTTIAIANVTESNFMTKGFGTVLLSIAVALIVQSQRRQTALPGHSNSFLARGGRSAFPKYPPAHGTQQSVTVKPFPDR